MKNPLEDEYEAESEKKLQKGDEILSLKNAELLENKKRNMVINFILRYFIIFLKEMYCKSYTKI